MMNLGDLVKVWSYEAFLSILLVAYFFLLGHFRFHTTHSSVSYVGYGAI